MTQAGWPHACVLGAGSRGARRRRAGHAGEVSSIERSSNTVKAKGYGEGGQAALRWNSAVYVRGTRLGSKLLPEPRDASQAGRPR